MAQSFLVDAVADAMWTCAIRPAPPAPPESCARWNSACTGISSSSSPCTSSTGGADLDLARDRGGLGIVRQHEHARIADDGGGRRPRGAAHMQRHHGALAEADQRQRRRRQLAARELGVEETLEHGRGLVARRPSARSDRGTSARTIAGRPAPGRRAPAHAATRTRCPEDPCQARPMSIRSLPSAP